MSNWTTGEGPSLSRVHAVGGKVKATPRRWHAVATPLPSGSTSHTLWGQGCKRRGRHFHLLAAGASPLLHRRFNRVQSKPSRIQPPPAPSNGANFCTSWLKLASCLCRSDRSGVPAQSARALEIIDHGWLFDRRPCRPVDWHFCSLTLTTGIRLVNLPNDVGHSRI